MSALETFKEQIKKFGLNPYQVENITREAITLEYTTRANVERKHQLNRDEYVNTQLYLGRKAGMSHDEIKQQLNPNR